MARNVWLLSVNRNVVNSNNVGNVNTSGNVNNNNANNSLRVPPDYAGNADKTHAEGMMPAKPRAGSRTPSRYSGESRPADGTSPRATEPTSGGATLPTSLEYAISPEALLESMFLCKRGTMWKTSVTAFYLHGVERCVRLSRELAAGTYKPRPPRHFVLTSPKRRDCCSIGIRDRIYQRSLNDNIVYPVMTRSLIKANCACQAGKGTDYARRMLVSKLKKHWHAHGCDGYVLQLDIRGYYPNMRHDVAKAVFRRRLPPDVYERVAAILDTQYSGDVGFQPGSQLVQIAGICVLDGLDHYVKERLRVKHYIRYMDDMLLISADRSFLVSVRREIEAYLKGMGYQLNTSKTRITRIDNRIPWLGYTYQLTETGKVVARLRPEKERQERRKLRRLARLVEDGKMTRKKADQCFESWLGTVSRNCTGNGEERKMRRYYESLWKDVRSDGEAQHG